jgi:hypothetical protein
VVGASGDISALFNARAKLNQYLAPKDANRNYQIDSVTMGSVVNGKALFTPDSQVKKAFTEGYYARGGCGLLRERAHLDSDERLGRDRHDRRGLAGDATAARTTLDMHTTVAVAAQNVGDGLHHRGCLRLPPGDEGRVFAPAAVRHHGIGGRPRPSRPRSTTGAKKNVCKSDGAELALTDFDAQTLTFIGSAVDVATART